MRMRSLFHLTCLAAFTLLLPGCMGQSSIDTLNARMNEQERKMQGLTSQLGSVEQVLPGQAEMWAQMQAMRQELNQVRGQLDEFNAGGGAASLAELKEAHTRLEGVTRRIAAQLGISVDALDAPLATPETSPQEPQQPLPPIAPPTPPAGTVTQPKPPAVTPPPAGSSDTATNLYNAGMNAFSSGQYANAIKAFTDFTKAFPKNKLTSNAHFWRGESYYQLKDYAGAALAYQQVIENFPGSSKFQSAMLKQGMAFHYAGKKDAARLRLNELIKKYPKSPEASRAKTFLQSNN